ncbi:hypothetical protein D3C86_1699820 [compost metagenome]
MPAEALAIALQAGVFLGDDQIIIRQGKQAHAKIAIAGPAELLDTLALHGQFILLARQASRGKPPQRPITLRRLCIVEDRHPVRLQFDNGRHLAGETFPGLPRAAIADIDIHRAVAKRASGIDQ